MIPNTSQQTIKDLAEYLSKDYNSFPVPLDLIIKEEQIPVFYDYYDSDSFDGMTTFEDGQYFIHINKDRRNLENNERGRFTLSHELGHYYIDAHREGLRQGVLEPHPSKMSKQQYDQIERQADYFASCLLMPEYDFKKQIEKKKFSFEIIKTLSERYNISKSACAIRFAEIGNHPIMIVYSEKGYIKWKKSSNDFPHQFLLYTNKVPEDTVMGEYFITNKFDNINITEQVWAGDWFNVKKDQQNDKFYEHCISYKNTALSIIWEI
ncbi:ImmA/IrrE family metallo-endopeptidase [Myroides marinus]|uniref:ImmA/IrrE family metallo-endopeptidase n=1 Tax=Myroides marinus TaxID=703342 RepID=UPI0025753CFF|nr:ImmA/IrrE family metallo-endopeptidase [Myroides marinus]MDM1350926.1 ImmA/IrrE family metallo-endopeptidase [Myroides marinus]MDM1358133.1 ImmA/IrrE family metallo-endopeptidase [Myroides marinus]